MIPSLENSKKNACSLVALALIGAALASSACSSDGVTPNCPELGKYRVRDATERTAALSKLEDAASKGCATLPVEFSTDGGAPGN